MFRDSHSNLQKIFPECSSRKTQSEPTTVEPDLTSVKPLIPDVNEATNKKTTPVGPDRFCDLDRTVYISSRDEGNPSPLL
jgi:hypothetical protein